MNSTQATLGERSSAEKSDRAQQLDAVAWAVFFIWVGIAMLAAIPWGWTLLGIGVLTLAPQLVRWQMELSVEGFWVACGVVFLASGVWLLLDLAWPLAPILIILFGAALLAKAVVGARL